ncbi:hypothetical protein RFI_37620, partial [Reticulomyxa filosa]
ENLDYLNYHETFYICNMTDNLQYWIVLVEKESFVVCCEHGELPSHNILSPLPFFKTTHHNIAPICLDIAKVLTTIFFDTTILEGVFVKSLHGHDFLIEDVLMYSGKLLTNETLSQQQIVKILQGLKMQWKKDKSNNKHSKFAFDFRWKHYGKNVVTVDERENSYLEKFRDSF